VIIFPSGKPLLREFLLKYLFTRHHTYTNVGREEPDLTEIGPRFEMKAYEIKLGTIEMEDADYEWSLRPYMNTSKKRDFL